MKCRKCGFELTGRFCEHCGEPAPISEPEPEEESVQASQENTDQNVKSDLNSNNNSAGSNNRVNNDYADKGNNNYANNRMNNNVDFDKALRDVPKMVDDISKSNVWIRGLKIIAGVEFAIIVIASVIIGLGLMGGRSGSVLLGFLVIVLGVFFAFISVALLMVFLNMAEDISEIRAKLNQKLK